MVSFLGPLGHFAFDDTGVAAGREEFVLQFPDQRGAPVGEGLERVMLAFGQAAFQHVEAAGERQAVRVRIQGAGRFDHQRADHEVGQRQGVPFLPHAVGSFAAQVRGLPGADRVLVSLLFVEHQLDPPAFVVACDQFAGRVLFGVEQVGQQAVFVAVSRALRIVGRVLDQPRDDPLSVLLAVVRRRRDLDQARAVVQAPDRHEDQIALNRGLVRNLVSAPENG